MDYPFFHQTSALPPQPFSSLYPISTSDHHLSHHHQADDFHDTTLNPDLNNFHHDFHGASFHLDPTAAAFVPPAHSPGSFSRSASSSDVPTVNNINNPASSTQLAFDANDDQAADRRSSSEENQTLTPAQSRRKAQNRAAQRAFRERKERHVRELEEKVTSLEQASNTLQADNERLKRELARFATENEILRATSKATSNNNSHHPHPYSNNDNNSEHHTVAGPMKYSPTDFYSLLVHDKGRGHPNPPHRITVDEETGERLLNSSATWDLIQNHDLYKRGLVDIGDICDRLKGLVQCNGQGPAFREGQIRRVIEESVAGGSDELI